MTMPSSGDSVEAKKQMLSKNDWREIILAYFKSDQTVSKFLLERGIAQQRDKFDKQFKWSGLKDLKMRRCSYSDAVSKYDEWAAEDAISSKGKRPTVTESQWRDFILLYYRMEKKSVSKFLEEKGIRQRDVFNKRWKASGLKDLKAKAFAFDDAVSQYDFWFEKWKQNLSQKQRSNFQKRSGFQIHEDVASTADDSNIGNDQPTMIQEVQNNFATENLPSVNNSDDETAAENSETASDSRNVLGDVSNVSNEKKRSKLSGSKMYEVMAEFYSCEDMRLLTFLKKKNALNHKTAVFRHWKESGLADMKERKEGLREAMEKYNEWTAIELSKASAKNKANASTVKALPEELERFMFMMIKQLALCGQGIGRKAVSQLFTIALKDWNTEGERLFSYKTLNRFIENYDLECRNVKNIDPARIAQVTEANRDVFFFRLDQIVALVHSLDPISCPWRKWDEVDSKNIDNMDEMGTDNTKFRDMLLIPKEVKARLFQATPEGDRAKTHISLCVFSKSNGRYMDADKGIEGAPMPMIIHSKSSSKKAKTNSGGDEARESRMQLYNPDEFIDVPSSYTKGISAENPLKITIRTSKNGSMTKEIFLDAMLHYLKSLSPDQGSNGKFVFLLLDSHVSRWHPIALYTLFKHRVIPIFFPSHLSIVVQPQDNGVILFLHKCIEEASMLQRLFKTDTSISYVNRILESAFKLFRDGERKKLIELGSNSTTRAYRIPGIVPRDPFSSGWRENLELYASFNGLRVPERESIAPYYGVRPKEKATCPPFSEMDVILLNEAVPILAKGDHDVTILDDPRTKCYVIANDIIENWVEKQADERTFRPRATTAVEKIALQHMEITHIIQAKAKSSESAVLDSNFKEAKREAILSLTLPMETIEAKPKAKHANDWLKVTKMTRPANMWNAFDGETTIQVSTEEIRTDWIINLEFEMFPSDKRLKEKRINSHRRRRDEKETLLKRMAKTVAEEERDAKIKTEFDRFMDRPTEEQTYSDFKRNLVSMIEKPSNHSVMIELDDEKHPINVCAHGCGTSSMSQLVIDNICKTLVGATLRSENRKRRTGNKVNRTRRGSDGIVKIAQIDDQHQEDCNKQREAAAKTKKKRLEICKRRLRELRKFRTSNQYHRFWRNDGSLDLGASLLTRPNLMQLLKIFHVEGRTKIAKGTKDVMKNALAKLEITLSSIEKIEKTLLDELSEFDDQETSRLDQSFATDISSSSEGILNESAINITTDCASSIGSIRSDTSSEDDAVSTRSHHKLVSFNESPEICEIPIDDILAINEQSRQPQQQNEAPTPTAPSPPSQTVSPNEPANEPETETKSSLQPQSPY